MTKNSPAPEEAHDTAPSSDLSAMGRAALEYARCGLHVFPVYEMTASGCSCGRTSNCKQGKHPRTSRGFLEGTTDEEAIRSWWTRWPDANIGIVTGKRLPDGSYLVILDIDPRNGGEESLAKLEAIVGEIKTRTISTGGGGAHFWFRSEFPLSGTKLRAFPGLDFQGVGKYVLAPPSNHESAGTYAFLGGELVGFPDALLGLILQESRQSRDGACEVESCEPTEATIARAEKYLQETAALSIEGQGGRNVFFGVSCMLTRTLRLPVDVAADLVERIYNPRLRDAGTTEWEGLQLLERLESARVTGSTPAGYSPSALKGVCKIGERMAKAHRTPKPPPTKKDKVAAGHAYDGERVKLTRTALTQMLYNWPDWDGVFWYDVLARKMRATDPPIEGKLTLEDGELSKGDIALIAHWLDVRGFVASKEMIEDALWRVVRNPDRQRNLIAEYLDSLSAPSSPQVLPTLATDVLGCTDPFANVLVMKALVGAARRARSPGAFHKSMLVLKGAQGAGKTPFVKILAGAWYHTTGNGNLADRDAILECQGKLLVEVEELAALSKADENALKTAISRTHDVITKKYEPDAHRYARSFILVGTTNKPEFLTDDTGSDRYHVVEVGERIDLVRLEKVRDLVWAEADALARAGVSSELDSKEKEQSEARNAEFQVSSVYIDDVRQYLSGKKSVGSAGEIVDFLVKGDTTRKTKAMKNEVMAAMKALGCTEKSEKLPADENGKRKSVRSWSVPEDLANAKKSASDRARTAARSARPSN